MRRGLTTEAGNRYMYLLIAVDYYTKWVEAYPLPSQKATTVAKVLVREFVCLFGTPHTIHSNQGRNFESAVLRCANFWESQKPELHYCTLNRTGWWKDLITPLNHKCPSLRMLTSMTGIHMFLSYLWHTDHLYMPQLVV